MRSLPRLVPLGVPALVMDLALAEAPTRKTLAECIAVALAQQPTRKAASASVQAARERVWESTAAYLPQVGASYSATRRHASNGSLTGSNFGGARAATFNFYSTGVALSQVLFDFGQNLSLFDGGLTTAQVGEAKANLQNLQANEEVTRQNITLDVRQATLNLRQAVESIRVADKGLQQARENLEIAEGRYRTGVGNIIELTDARTSLTSAEASQVRAVVNYRTALASLERATAHPFSAE